MHNIKLIITPLCLMDRVEWDSGGGWMGAAKEVEFSAWVLKC